MIESTDASIGAIALKWLGTALGAIATAFWWLIKFDLTRIKNDLDDKVDKGSLLKVEQLLDHEARCVKIELKEIMKSKADAAEMDKQRENISHLFDKIDEIKNILIDRLPNDTKRR